MESARAMLKSMRETLLIGVGGFVGANARYWGSLLLARSIPGPWPTLGINLLGSFLLGILVGWNQGESSRLLLGVGLLGGFTTFSTFSLELAGMMPGPAWGKGVLYACMSVVFGVLLGMAGIAVGRIL
ncbi:MAG: fluoride efflux transporter CrcB, partial [Armatimonadota bacterium]